MEPKFIISYYFSSIFFQSQLSKLRNEIIDLQEENRKLLVSQTKIFTWDAILFPFLVFILQEDKQSLELEGIRVDQLNRSVTSEHASLTSQLQQSKQQIRDLQTAHQTKGMYEQEGGAMAFDSVSLCLSPPLHSLRVERRLGEDAKRARCRQSQAGGFEPESLPAVFPIRKADKIAACSRHHGRAPGGLGDN